MALFNKFFSKRKLLKEQSQHIPSSSQFPFSKDQFRVLLFRECEGDWRGRRLLFDSSALEQMTSAELTQHIALTANKASPSKLDKNYYEGYNGECYYYDRPNPDYKGLGETVFGSVAVSFRGTSFKVHWLHSPARILCSQVFHAPVQPYSSASSSSSNTHSSSGYNNSSNNCSEISSDPISNNVSESNSLSSFTVNDSFQNLTSRIHPLEFTTTSLDNDDYKFISQSAGDGSSGFDPWQQRSGRSSLASIYSDNESSSRKMSFESAADFVGCEFSRLNRRIIKNLSTSFESLASTTSELNQSNIESNYHTVIGHTTNLSGLSDGCMSKLRRNSELAVRRKTTSGDAISSNSSTIRSRRPRLAVAICITMSECMEQEMLCFCSEHMALLELMLNRVRASAENAYINRQSFLPLLIKAWCNASEWLTDLFSAPRLTNHLWLSLSTGGKKSQTVFVISFIQDLMSLLSRCDTKDTNFFISTLLTAVLTHHLGWVRENSNIRGNFANKGNVHPLKSKLLQGENMKLSEISKMFPYNALWAQLGDLYGAITSPVKLSKTIVCGSEANVKTIEKILNVLTYFIRCSEIRRNCQTKVFDKEEINKTVNKQINSPETTASFQGLNNNSSNFSRVRKTNGITRTPSTIKELSNMVNVTENELSEIRVSDNLPESNTEKYLMLLKNLKKNVMNDIPKVLAYRDSRFVKQELRIGNKSMDTGIEMTAKDKQFLCKYQKNLLGDHIKLTVTRPDSDEIVEINELDDETDFNSQMDNFISLSNLITANSCGAQTVMKLFWGKEPNKGVLNGEHVQTFQRIKSKHQNENSGDDFSDKLRTIPENEKPVMFLLGDDEKLVNLKKNCIQSAVKNDSEDNKSVLYKFGAMKKSCKHKKKHSGVKFNFEKYPQIATNYMKSKNLEFHEHDVLEKGMKIEREQVCEASTSGTMIDISSTVTLQDERDSDEECECCKDRSTLYLQTPSNATDLEFSSDQFQDYNFLSQNSSHIQYFQTINKDIEVSPDKNLKVVEIPMLTSIAFTRDVQGMIKKQPGFTPSLFTSTSDHYIADMILQGVTSKSQNWEAQLKQDLTVSSHCAVIDQSQAENVAIVANIDKWDVRLVSSHSNVLPSNSTANGIVGMSQMIASMLETVQSMFNSGISEFQCVFFIESKLREIYLHSETLASFLLETEFCSLSTLTSALNLSVNDIPLLMSVATVHSPLLGKKYGISFR